MTRFKLDRRTVIKGAGTIAIALPWLEIMGRGSKARAQTASVPLKRFMTVYQPGGAVRHDLTNTPGSDKYTPTGTETAFTLSPVLAPLADMQKRLLVVDGTNLTCGDQSKYGVEQHQGGEVGWLTGAIQQGAGNYIAKNSPSIDQVLADRLSTGKPYGSLQLAVRWATGKSNGKLSPINAMNFSNTGPMPPRLDPQDIFNDAVRRRSSGTGAGGSLEEPTRVDRRRQPPQVDPGLRRQEVHGAGSKAGRGRSGAARAAPHPDSQPRAAHDGRLHATHLGDDGMQDAHQGRHDRIQPHQRPQFSA